MPSFRIWWNNTEVTTVDLEDDDTLTISLDNPDGEDFDIVGVTHDGQVVTWDNHGEVENAIKTGQYGYCLACGKPAGPDYHLAGAADPEVENNVVCDDCWDERLR
jgi:hypothetical protein